MQKSFFILILLGLLIIIASLYLVSCNEKGKRISYTANQNLSISQDSVSAFRFKQDGRFRGMHIHSDQNVTKTELLPLVQANVEWIVHTPYLFQKSHNSTELKLYDYVDFQNIEKERYDKDLLNSTNACNIKCVVKPLIWIENPAAGEWRGTIRFDNEADWITWSNNYRNLILEQAKACEAMKVEAFCVGTELTSIVETHPDFLRKLIKEVRSVYGGIVLYAANWNSEYEMVPFWDEVDYIGISAYFPLTKKSFPSVRKIKRGWRKHLPGLKSLSKRYDKQIVFTEVGYRSTSQAATHPWEWVKDAHRLGEKASPKTQANCYEALFESCWEEDWFAGVLLWDWKIGTINEDDRVDISFHTQGKEAEEVIAWWFGR